MAKSGAIMRARKDQRGGKSPSTQAGEFVREEFHHIREGKHGARSTEQAIAIGLSKARRAGVKLPPPKRGRASKEVRIHAMQDYEKGREHIGMHSSSRSRAVLKALRREGPNAASTAAISRHTRQIAKHRTAAERSDSARKAARTRRAV